MALSPAACIRWPRLVHRPFRVVLVGELFSHDILLSLWYGEKPRNGEWSHVALNQSLRHQPLCVDYVEMDKLIPSG
jgi:hypothetical protein